MAFNDVPCYRKGQSGNTRRLTRQTIGNGKDMNSITEDLLTA